MTAGIHSGMLTPGPCTCRGDGDIPIMVSS